MKRAWTLLVAAALLSSCAETEPQISQEQWMSMSDVTAEQWNALADKKIFFGHQSVGRNIMAGVKDLLAEQTVLVARVVNSMDPGTVAGPAFIEADLGKNGDPLSKTRDFAAVIERGMSDADAIAMHKYCYVDISAATDVEQLFAQYSIQMGELRTKYPKLTLVHVTMPLRVAPAKSTKERVKQLLGRADQDLNIKRNRFNQLLLAQYKGKEPVFDLASVESTRADGTRLFERVKGASVFSLAPEWSNDGGHLNEAGRRMVAEQLVIFLARLSSPSSVKASF